MERPGEEQEAEHPVEERLVEVDPVDEPRARLFHRRDDEPNQHTAASDASQAQRHQRRSPAGSLSSV